MRRRALAWDRFYRDQEAPWRGERPLWPLAPWLGDPVLELGCGNGKTLRPLLTAGYDVVALDVSWNILRRLPASQRLLADASSLPVAAGSFATVLDLHCTGHLLHAGRRQAAREIARALSPGGHWVVERLSPEDVRAVKGESVEPGLRRLADGRTTHFSDEEGLVAEGEAVGLRLVDAATSRRSTRWHGHPVVRASTRCVFRKD